MLGILGLSFGSDGDGGEQQESPKRTTAYSLLGGKPMNESPASTVAPKGDEAGDSPSTVAALSPEHHAQAGGTRAVSLPDYQDPGAFRGGGFGGATAAFSAPPGLDPDVTESSSIEGSRPAAHLLPPLPLAAARGAMTTKEDDEGRDKVDSADVTAQTTKVMLWPRTASGDDLASFIGYGVLAGDKNIQSPFQDEPAVISGPLATAPVTATASVPLPPVSSPPQLQERQPLPPPPGRDSSQVVSLAAALPEPELGGPDLPTAGSRGHRLGTCKPCAFLHTKGCKNGPECAFCHLCERGEKKRRQREKWQTAATVQPQQQQVMAAQDPLTPMGLPLVPCPWMPMPMAASPHPMELLPMDPFGFAYGAGAPFNMAAASPLPYEGGAAAY